LIMVCSLFSCTIVVEQFIWQRVNI
jgi:hypothetical protein